MSNIVMVDCDGVLLDFNKAFAKSYQQVFGKELLVVKENAYPALNMFGLEDVADYSHFENIFSHESVKIWEKMPVWRNAVESINELVDKGYDVRCLTSMPPKYKDERLKNLQDLGFKIDIVYPVCRHEAKEKGIRNPKLAILEEYQPLAFIDDLLSNFLDCENINTKLYLLDNDYAKGHNPNELITETLEYSTVKRLQDFVDLFPDLTIKNTIKPK